MKQTLLVGAPSKTYSKKLGWIVRTGVRRFGTCFRECLVSPPIVRGLKMQLAWEENVICYGIFLKAPCKNVFEETRLDPAHGGPALWHLLPRVLGFTLQEFLFLKSNWCAQNNICSGIFLRGGSKLPPASFFSKN